MSQSVIIVVPAALVKDANVLANATGRAGVGDTFTVPLVDKDGLVTHYWAAVWIDEDCLAVLRVLVARAAPWARVRAGKTREQVLTEQKVGVQKTRIHVEAGKE